VGSSTIAASGTHSRTNAATSAFAAAPGTSPCSRSRPYRFRSIQRQAGLSLRQARLSIANFEEVEDESAGTVVGGFPTDARRPHVISPEHADRARAEGFDWGRIGRLLGVSRQSARERYQAIVPSLPPHLRADHQSPLERQARETERALRDIRNGAWRRDQGAGGDDVVPW
jgi:hypothetical protein